MASSEPPSDQHASFLVTASEACAILRVKPATLYTYVSRGLVHPVASPGRKSSRYLREEIERLRARSGARNGHAAVDATALRWGRPVVATSITEITDAGPSYRGYLATDLARNPGQFENVAELLWSGVLPDDKHIWRVEPRRADVGRALAGMGIEMNDQIRMMRVFAVAAITLGGGSLAEELRSGSMTRYSREIIFAFAGCCGVLGREQRFVEPEGDKSVAEHILKALRHEPTPDLLHAMNAALIMAADHELASPTFAARIAASAGAGLHACIVAALAAQTGSMLASGCDRAEDVLRGFATAAQVKARVADAQRRGARLPGFGLPLYPHGDPRAACLIDLARSYARQTRHSELAFQYFEEARTRLCMYPNIELGLVALCLVHGLPARSASAIWAIGRSAGWIAHTLEQRLAGFAMRPRGHFQV
jgi:citrate synthase